MNKYNNRRSINTTNPYHPIDDNSKKKTVKKIKRKMPKLKGVVDANQKERKKYFFLKKLQ